VREDYDCQMMEYLYNTKHGKNRVNCKTYCRYNFTLAPLDHKSKLIRS